METAPDTTPRPFPGLAQAFGLLAVWMILANMAAIPGFVAGLLHFPRIGAWLILAGGLATLAGTLWIASQWGHCSWKAFWPHRPVPAAVWAGTLLGGLGLVLLMNGLDNLFHRLWPAPAWLGRMIQDAGAPAIVLGAALTEEPLCRGILLPGFTARYGATRAMVFTALLFALIHLNPWQALGAFFLGLWFAWLVQRTGSLWPAILGHALNNGVALLALRRHWPYLGDHRLQPWTWWVAGALLTGVALYLVWQATRQAPEAAPVPEGHPAEVGA